MAGRFSYFYVHLSKFVLDIDEIIAGALRDSSAVQSSNQFTSLQTCLGSVTRAGFWQRMSERQHSKPPCSGPCTWTSKPNTSRKAKWLVLGCYWHVEAFEWFLPVHRCPSESRAWERTSGSTFRWFSTRNNTCPLNDWLYPLSFQGSKFLQALWRRDCTAK